MSNNIYELYLKSNFTDKELALQYEMKDYLDKHKKDYLKSNKVFFFRLFLILLNVILIIGYFLFSGFDKQGFSIFEFLFFTPFVLFIFLLGFIYFLYFKGDIVDKKFNSFKSQLKIDFNDIVEKPDFLIFLQNKVREIYNFDLQQAFEYDFKNVNDYFSKSTIIDFLSLQYYCGSNNFYCSFYSTVKKLIYNNKTYSFDTTENLLANKNILIEILSLIKLPNSVEEKLSEDLKIKLHQLNLKTEKEDFLNKFKKNKLN